MTMLKAYIGGNVKCKHIYLLLIHTKNKLVEFKLVLWIIIPGIITCVLGCLIAKNTSGDILKRCFGGFLILLSIFQFVMEIKKKKAK